VVLWRFITVKVL